MRLDKPIDVLVDHAINGHRGSRGLMPPKGGFEMLSDEQVEAAVVYIVARGEWLVSKVSKLRVACTGGSDDPPACTPAQSRDQTLLQLLWALTETRRAR